MGLLQENRDRGNHLILANVHVFQIREITYKRNLFSGEVRKGKRGKGKGHLSFTKAKKKKKIDVRGEWQITAYNLSSSPNKTLYLLCHKVGSAVFLTERCLWIMPQVHFQQRQTYPCKEQRC